MPWTLLLIAGLLEVVWAIGLKYSEGFTHWPATTITLLAMFGSIVFLGLSLKHLPVGTAYAVWTGIGAIGTAILGIFLFNESSSLGRLFCIALIAAGILGLKLTHE